MIIERGIPIPKPRLRVASKYSQAINELEPGDAIRVKTQGLANAVATAMKSKGYRPVMRKVMIKGEIFFRVWRDAMSDDD
jgi:hypothetical protein